MKACQSEVLPYKYMHDSIDVRACMHAYTGMYRIECISFNLGSSFAPRHVHDIAQTCSIFKQCQYMYLPFLLEEISSQDEGTCTRYSKVCSYLSLDAK